MFFGPMTLSPGQSYPYDGSFTVPASYTGCTISSLVVVQGNDNCSGTSTSASAARACLVVTSPKIVVTKSCPPNPVAQGSMLTFSATVANAGNTTLTNVVVLNDCSQCNRPAPEVVFRAASLAPGQVTNFVGSYLVPGNCCSITDTLLASGSDICNGTTVTDTATAICPVLFTPRITVTKVCPALPTKVGEPLTYSGIVSNAGNVTLTDVIVYNDVTLMNNPVLGLAALAPGEAVAYTSTYSVPTDFCGRDTVTAQGVSLCGGTVTDSETSTCPIETDPAIAIVRDCPSALIPRGALVNFTATVVNIGDVTLTDVIVRNTLPTNNTPVFGPVTLAAGESKDFTYSYTTPMDCNCCELVDTLTARGLDKCSARSVAATATAVCEYASYPGISASITCPPAGLSGVIKFTGVIVNSGDCTLTNVIVTSNESESTRLAGPITLARGETQEISGSYTVTTVSPLGYGLRVTATGAAACTGQVVTDITTCSGDAPSRPVIAPPIVRINGVTLTWSTVPGHTYRVQSAGSINSPQWQDESGEITAESATASKVLPLPNTQQRLYRVIVTQ